MYRVDEKFFATDTNYNVLPVKFLVLYYCMRADNGHIRNMYLSTGCIQLCILSRQLYVSDNKFHFIVLIV